MTDGRQEEVLTFGKLPLRSVVIDGLPWFAIDDLFAIADHPVPPPYLSRFSDRHFDRHAFADTPDESTPVLSALGAQTVALRVKWPRGLILARWLRKHAHQVLCDNAGEAVRPTYSLMADGTPPPKKFVDDAHFAEWYTTNTRRQPERMGTDLQAFASDKLGIDLVEADGPQSSMGTNSIIDTVCRRRAEKSAAARA